MMKQRRMLSAIAFGCLGTNTHGLTLSNNRLQSRLFLSSYSRGAEIWPECNEEPIPLTASFPGGNLPNDARLLLNEKQLLMVKEQRTTTHTMLPVRRILQRAARAQEQCTATSTTTSTPKNTTPRETLDKTPTVIAIFLLITRLVNVQHILLALTLTAYLGVLQLCAQSTRRDQITPRLPSLPPQGHVPALILNPLGTNFTNSDQYDSWLKLGAFLSLLGPLAIILYNAIVPKNIGQARACAGPLFLLCWQALVESLSRKVMAPLPLRILVPIAFNTLRLPPLWQWATTTAGTNQTWAMANLIYWSANLFGFLIPIAAMRYLRAHVLCVETEQVTTRPGFETTVGLLP